MEDSERTPNPDNLQTHQGPPGLGTNHSTVIISHNECLMDKVAKQKIETGKLGPK